MATMQPVCQPLVFYKEDGQNCDAGQAVVAMVYYEMEFFKIGFL